MMGVSCGISESVQSVLGHGHIDGVVMGHTPWTSTPEVALSEQMFVPYRPITLSSSCLESDRSEQNVNKHLLAESVTCFGLKMIRNA